MNIFLIFFSILLGCFLLSPLSVTAQETEMKTDRFSMRFAADGRVASFRLLSKKKELLNRRDPGDGFVLRTQAGAGIRFSQLVFGTDPTIVARTANGTQKLVLKVHRQSQYIAFRIERMIGIPRNGGLILSFEMNVDKGVRCLPLDYMTELERRDQSLSVQWKYLWQRDADDPLGGFALYYPENEDDEDDTILQIWTGEGMPHPKVDGDWTLERAREWMKEWRASFADQSRLNVVVESLDELYQSVEYAEKMDAKFIYLWPKVWRGAYWPTDMRNDAVNREIFPNGEDDVIAVSKHLRARGMGLMFHWLCGGIGHSDPDYVGARPDRRLASWGQGKIYAPISEHDTVIRVRPDEGVEIPYMLTRDVRTSFHAPPPALKATFKFNIVRIDNELIRVGSFEDTDREVWMLKDCRRGLFKTTAVAHRAGDGFSGLIDAYEQNFVPDNNSTLLEEIARNYANLMNRCGIMNANFDGFEIHSYDGEWGKRKLATLLYQNLDHPVAANSSAGLAPECFLEYKLNSTQRLVSGIDSRERNEKVRAVIMLAHPSREATSLDDANFTMSQGAAQRACAFDVGSFDVKGVPLTVLKTHGMTDKILKTVKNWKTVNRHLTVKQREQIRAQKFLKKFLRQAGSHPESDMLFTLSSSDKEWRIYPVKILTRKEGDIKWHMGQEHGVISPKHYIKPGDLLELENPFHPQVAQFIIRVLPAFEYDNPDNVSMQPTPSDLKNPTDTRIEAKDSVLVFSEENARNTAIWREGEKHGQALPEWRLKQRLDMSSLRGIGMWMTGDGKDEIFCVQIRKRDYVIPIRFKDRRYIEIPNGEVAWADGFWGWRFGAAKYCDYTHIQSIWMGFGKVPARTNVRATIEGLKFLKEISTDLKNPVIKTGSGTLAVEGSVVTGHYLVYESGNESIVYDENWHEIKRLPVKSSNYVMPSGYASATILSSQEPPFPWLQVQFKTLGDPITVPK